MATHVAIPPVADPVADLIAEFELATRPQRIEVLASRLGATGDGHAVRPLLARLGEPCVQTDRRVEAAVCCALASLSVMCPCGDDGYALRPRHRLAADVVQIVEDLDAAIPLRYFLARTA